MVQPAEGTDFPGAVHRERKASQSLNTFAAEDRQSVATRASLS